jgi:hypothetical protein
MRDQRRAKLKYIRVGLHALARTNDGRMMAVSRMKGQIASPADFLVGLPHLCGILSAKARI